MTYDETQFLAALLTLRPGETMADRLGEYLRPAPWHALAQCRNTGVDVFFAASPDAAKAICAGCPAADPCRDAGAGEAGVWGGMTEKERRLVRSSGRLGPSAA